MDTKQEITDLTCCRALFALWVFAYHVDLHAHFHLGPAANLLRRGYLGVDGFFILSGLILARVHPELSKTPATALRFWGKRLARIYPVHLAIIILLAGIVAAGLAGGLAPHDPTRFTLASLIENLLLIHGWGFGNALAWNYPSWSISAEWAGYLLFPAVWFGMGYCNEFIIGQIVIICLPILGLIAFVSGHGLNISGHDVLLRFLTEFVAGMATSRLVPVFADNLPTRNLTMIGLGLTAIGTFTGLDTLAALGLWLAVASLAMHADAERPALFRNAGLLRALGLLSYSFYMSFATVELLMAQGFRHIGWDPAGHKLLYAGGMTLLTLLLAMILHVLVEVPFRRLGDRLLAEPAPLAAARLRL